ncbi:MAG: hypothetical protein WDZ94_01350 [Patescibacteria group bacterium]
MQNNVSSQSQATPSNYDLDQSDQSSSAMQMGSMPKKRKKWLIPGLMLGISVAGLLVLIIHFSAITSFFSAAADPEQEITKLENLLQARFLYAGAIDNLQVREVEDGVFTIQSRHLSCEWGPGCDPDRYELQFDRYFPHLFGLGMQASQNQVEINLIPKEDGSEEFLDLHFSNGRPRTDAELAEVALHRTHDGDIGRLRTPVYIIPQENIIMAYIQPDAKRLRISRHQAENYSHFVMKLHETMGEGAPGKLLVLKGDSLTDVYQKYYRALRQEGFFFKQPHWNAYGIMFETFAEFEMRSPLVGGATATALRDYVDRYSQMGIKPSAFVFGTGYWKLAEEVNVCSATNQDYGGIYRSPTMEVFQFKDQEALGYNLRQFFSELLNQDIFPMIGMRHFVSASNSVVPGTNQSGEEFFTQLAADRNIRNPLQANYHYKDFRPDFRYKHLNFNNDAAMQMYVDLAATGYAPMRGIKEDDMPEIILRNNRPDWNNFQDGQIRKIFPHWNNYFDGDVVLTGRNDWFSVGTDLQVSQGWVDWPPRGQEPNNMYRMKYVHDSTMTQIFSGYPHPQMALLHTIGYTNVCDSNRSCYDYCGVSGSEEELLADYRSCCQMNGEAYVRAIQAATFHGSVTKSEGVWHLPNDADRRAALYFLNMRMRLHQYAFDQARNWYHTGVPHLVRPLLFDFQDDPEVYKQYTALNPNNPNEPKNQYMFGNALLVRPIFFPNQRTVTVYFPEGIWKPLIGVTPEIVGPGYAEYTLQEDNDYPVFLKEGEILIIGQYEQPEHRMAYVYLEHGNASSVYSLHNQDGQIVELQVRKEDAGVWLINRDTNARVAMNRDPFGKEFFIGDLEALLAIEPKEAAVGAQPAFRRDSLPTPTIQPADSVTEPAVSTPTTRRNAQPQPTPPQALYGDLNNDGVVDTADLQIVIEDIQNPPPLLRGDLNDDGVVDIQDYNSMLELISQ